MWLRNAQVNVVILCFIFKLRKLTILSLDQFSRFCIALLNVGPVNKHNS